MLPLCIDLVVLGWYCTHDDLPLVSTVYLHLHRSSSFDPEGYNKTPRAFHKEPVSSEGGNGRPTKGSTVRAALPRTPEIPGASECLPNRSAGTGTSECGHTLIQFYFGNHNLPVGRLDAGVRANLEMRCSWGKLCLIQRVGASPTMPSCPDTKVVKWTPREGSGRPQRPF